jgi:hypothetical protein
MPENTGATSAPRMTEKLARAIELQKIKAGDRVRTGGDTRYQIETVDRITSTQVVIGRYRYNRTDGIQVGFRAGSRLKGLASPSECRTWDESKEREREEQQRKVAAEVAHHEKRRELTAMFGDDDVVQVNRNEWGDPERWQIEIRNLTEEAVRQMAAILRGTELKDLRRESASIND